MACSTFDFLNAAAYGTAAEVRVMLDSGIDVNVRNEGSRETALMTAAGGGNIDTVKLLVERGADVGAKSFEGGTALLVAIEQRRDEVVEYLLSHGANPNDKLAIEPGLTALCMAAQRGYLRILKALLKAGADTEKRAGDGSTALANAAFKGHDDVARELIESGADKRAKSAGMTAEEFAERFGYSSTAAVIRETPQSGNKRQVGSPTSTGCLIPLLIGISAMMCMAIIMA
ncbi:MAG: ankyrin repeat domain-containing protein [Kiritimatiellae bacterium]|nr:ankyrin repeat domain-containing protein [Kiritimatiellia bacterium]